MTNFTPSHPKIDLLISVRHWLDTIEMRNPVVARWLCQLIPSQCPFARDIHFWGNQTLHIPPLCKLNPLYEELVSLRFRALSYLADECNQDIANYI